MRCIQEEKSEQSQSAMFDYLGNLMEDASDFSWDSAKACLAILLANMEADSVSWVETDKVDQFCRYEYSSFIHERGHAGSASQIKTQNSG